MGPHVPPQSAESRVRRVSDSQRNMINRVTANKRRTCTRNHHTRLERFSARFRCESADRVRPSSGARNPPFLGDTQSYWRVVRTFYRVCRANVSPAAAAFISQVRESWEIRLETSGPLARHEIRIFSFIFFSGRRRMVVNDRFREPPRKTRVRTSQRTRRFTRA